MRDDINGLPPMHLAHKQTRFAKVLTAAWVAVSIMAASFAATPTAAQSPLSAALYVNDSAITNYEITQKMRFLEFIGANSSNMRELAIERLIEDRLQQQEGTRLGGRMTPDSLDQGMAEFAARAWAAPAVLSRPYPLSGGGARTRGALAPAHW